VQQVSGLLSGVLGVLLLQVRDLSLLVQPVQPVLLLPLLQLLLFPLLQLLSLPLLLPLLLLRL
jgi:hypothetical protein